MRTKWFNAIPLLTLLLGMLFPMAAQAAPVSDPPAVAPSAPSVQENPPAEIERALLDKLAVEGAMDFVVVMAEQADLSAAYKITDWSERGWYVYNTLREVADRTQAPIVNYAKQNGFEFKTFFTTNSIQVQSGTLSSAHEIAKLPGVALIREPRVAQVDPAAVEGPQQPLAPSAYGWNLDALDPDGGLYGLQAVQVWEQYGIKGSGIVVANIDTGVTYQHEALDRQYRGNLGGSYDHDFDWYAPTGDAAQQCGGDAATSPCDSDGHGSGTAGIMVGETADLNEQLGVAPAAKWIACMGCDLYGPGGAGGCSEEALTACADWMVAPCPIGADPGDPTCDPDMRPNVVNNSWGGGSGDDWYRGYVQAWTAAGIFPAFSAGNTVACAAVGSPGDNPEAFGTAAHSTNGENIYAGGPSLFFPNPSCDPEAHEVDPHLNAPTYGRTAGAVPGSYYNIGGTSGASPHTAGAVALIWAANPGLIGDIWGTFTILEQTADRTSTQSWREGDCGKPACAGSDPYPNYEYGWGYLDALAAVDEALMMADNGTLQGTVTDASTSAPVAGAQVMATLNVTRSWQTTTDALGEYSMVVFSGTYTVGAYKYGYLPASVADVAVVKDMTTTQDIALTPAAFYTVDGYVTDATTGWPLYAKINIAGYPDSPIWTDPATGYYSVELAEGIIYTFDVGAWAAGYNAATASVGPLTGDVTQNFALQADLGTCVAPGYEAVVAPTPLVTTDFDAGIPGDWTVVNNGGSCVWTDMNPGGRANMTGGSGTFAIADSDTCGSGTTSDTELQTPMFDASAYDALWIEYKNDYYDLGSIAKVDVFDGTDWINAENMSGASQRGPQTRLVTTNAGAGSSTTQVRWRYAAEWDWWWEVDDVRVYGVNCVPPTDGGLVVGNVYDANLNQPLTGADVANDVGDTTTTAFTPDPAVDDAFYTLFSPSGLHAFTAMMPKFMDGVVNVNVVDGGTVVQNFYLDAGYLVATPAGVEVTVEAGDNSKQWLSLENQGGLDALYDLLEVPGGFTPLYPIHIPTSTGQDFLKGADAPSTGLAPLGRTSAPSDEEPVQVLRPMGSTAYSTEPNISQFLNFDLDVPGTFNVISTFANAVWAGDFGANGMLYAINSDTGQFISIDPATGAQTAIGPIAAYSGESWTGMATDPTTGMVYASSTSCGSGSSLYSVDTSTGTATRLGQLTNASCAIALAVDNTGQMYTYDIVSDVLLTVDKATGAGTVVGSIGFDANYGQGMDFDHASGQLYMAAFNGGTFQGELRVVDRATGNTALVGVLGGAGGPFQLGWLGLTMPSGGGADAIPWLTETPISGTVAAGDTQNVMLTFDAGIPEANQPGTYYGSLKVKTDTPYPDATVPVTMNVTAPATWGKVTGQVTSLGYCDLESNLFLPEEVEITIESDTGAVWTLYNDADGTYRLWLDPIYSPLTITATAPEHAPVVVTNVIVSGGATTTVDIGLRWLVPCVTVSPTPLEMTLELGYSDTVPFTVINGGAAGTSFDLMESDGGFTIMRPVGQAGTFEFLDVSETAKDGMLYNGSVLRTSVRPAEYRAYVYHSSQATPQDFNILVYADDDQHYPSATELALQELGLSYTFYGDGELDYFVAAVSTGPWDLVILAADSWGYYDTPELDALHTYVSGGGKVIVHSWIIGYDALHYDHPLWAAMGADFVSWLTTPGPLYWWEPGNQMFTYPESVPEFVDITNLGYLAYGAKMNPLTAIAEPGTAIAGFSTTPALDQGGIIVRDDDATIYKGLTDNCNDGDEDADGVWDAAEWWTNAINYILYGTVGGEIPWLSEDPESGVVDPDSTFVVDVTFDAGATITEVTQPGEYFGTLLVDSDDSANDKIAVPVTMTVTPPDSWGKLMGMVTGLGYCDADPAPVAGADILVEGSDGVTWTLTTDANGVYAVWLDEGHSPMTITVSVPEHEKGEALGVAVTGGFTTTQDFDLRWLVPCVNVAPAGVHATLELGATATEVMTLTNTGAVDTDWSLAEENLGAPTVTPPGVVTLFTEAFEGAFPPAGWTRVLNSGTNWESSATTGYGNNTGGAGLFADANSDWWGGGMDAELWTPSFDFSAAAAPMLSFQSDFNDYGGSDHGYVDVSVDGGTTWTNLLHYDRVDVRGPRLVELDLSAYAGQPSVIIRFHYIAPGWDWYWQVDDVQIVDMDYVTWLAENPASGNLAADTGEQVVDVDFDASVVDQPGEYYANLWANSDDPYAPAITPVTMTVTAPATWALLDGTVYSLGYCDAESNPLEGAEVTIENGVSVLLTTDVSGVYSYWLAPGTYTVTVSAAEHVGAQAVVTIVAGVNQTADFDLRWIKPCVTATPDTIDDTLAMGETADHLLTIINNGAGDANFFFTEWFEGYAMLPSVVVASEPAAPLRLVKIGDNAFTTNPKASSGVSIPPLAKVRPEGVYALTHSLSQTIIDGNSVSCNAGGLHADNSYIRVFDLAAFGITEFLNVQQVEVGIERAVAGSGGVQPGVINLYTLSGPLTWANMTLIGSANVDVADQTLTVINVPIAANVPAGSVLVVEFYTPDGQVDGHSLYVGSNNLGQTAPTYLAAADCGVAEPTDTAVIGFPDMHLVMNVIGYTPEVVDLPWLDENPLTGVVLGDSTTGVTVTLDAGQVPLPGVYYATLGVDSDDPVNSRYPVSVAMTVTLPTTYGEITGLVYGMGYCDGEMLPLAGASVLIEGSDGMSITVTTDVSGAYEAWRDEAGSPYTITATYSDHLDGVATGVVVTGTETTVQDLSLRWMMPCASVAPTSIHEVVTLGMSTTVPMTVSNAGAGDLNWNLTEADGGMTLLGPQGDQIVWLSRNTEGVTVSGADSGQTVAYPAAYRYVPARVSAYNVLVYTDDWQHTTPNTYPELALQRLGLAATVHVDGDYTGFVTDLTTGGPWDLVIWSGENVGVDTATLSALLAYVQNGGALAATYWAQLNYPSDPLWAAMDFAYVGNDTAAPPAYWWDPAHALFTNPESAPEWLVRFARSGTSQGTYIEPLVDGVAVAGYTTAPAPNQANIVIGNEGRTLYKGIRDLSTDADADTDGVVDGVELWENIMVGLLEGFGGDVPWLFEDPTAGTALADATSSVTITLDAGVPEVTQPGDYFATLTLKSDDTGKPEIAVPVTMTVTAPDTWGKLAGTVTGLGYCDVNPQPIEGAVVYIQSAVTKTVEVLVPVFEEGFEATDGGFTHSGTQDEWEWGMPTVWPNACASGSYCWGTDLDDTYNASADQTLLSPVIDLSGVAAGSPLTVTWQQAWYIESASWDHAYAEVSINGGAWTEMWAHIGGTAQTSWTKMNYDVSAAAGGTVQFRWRLTSDSSVQYNGYYIDDVRIETPEEVVVPVDWTLTTDVSGTYGIWFDEMYSPFTVTVAYEAGYEAQTVAGVVIAGQATTVQDFGLRWYQPCVSTSDTAVEVTLALDETDTHTLTLFNDGAADTAFWLMEQDLGVVTAGPQAVADVFGYAVEDSNSIFGPAYDFVDIKAFGTPVALGDDDFAGPLPIGFDFPFYGASAGAPNLYDEVFINSNGFLSFGAGSTDLSNDVLPNPLTPNNIIALMWDDLVGGTAYYYTFDTCPYASGACMVVQYEGFTHIDAQAAGTWQAILFRNGNVLVQFADAGEYAGAGSTTGIENAFGTDGITYAANTPALADALAVCFAYPGNSTDCMPFDAPWLDESVNFGDILADDSTPVTLSFDASVPEVTGPGVYLASLSLLTNDPYNWWQVIPVTLTVERPATWGEIEGTVIGWTHCDNAAFPVEGATVFVESVNGVDTWALTTDISGTYGLWLDATHSPVTVTITHDDYVTLVESVPFVAGDTPTEVAHELRMNVPCFGMDQYAIEFTVTKGHTHAEDLMLINNGAGMLNIAAIQGDGWMTPDMTSGTVDPDSTHMLNVVFSAVGMSIGQHVGELVIMNNDPMQPVMTVPVTMTVLTPTLLVDVFATPPDVTHPGDLIVYTIVVTNTSDGPVDVDLTNMIPASTTYIVDSVTGGLSYIQPTTGDDYVMWSGTLAQLTPGTFSFVVRVNEDVTGGAIDETVVVETEDSVFSDTVSLPVVVLPKTVLVDVSATPPGVTHPGNLITYTIVVTNTSLRPVDIVLTDLIPANTTYVVGSAMGGLSYVQPPMGDDYVTWVGTLPQPAPDTFYFSATFSFVVRVDATVTGGTIDNTAQVETEDGTFSDTVSVVVEFYRIYLPLTLRNYSQ